MLYAMSSPPSAAVFVMTASVTDKVSRLGADLGADQYASRGVTVGFHKGLASRRADRNE